MIQAVAEGLEELRDQVAFVGGATTALYIDDEASPQPTPSDDVDFVVEITSQHEYSKLEKTLRKKGFTDPMPEEGKSPPICRKVYKNINVDIMPTDEKVLGFSNPWYSDAMKNRETYQLPDDSSVFIFNVVYFLATKLEAFNSRGKVDDIRFSQDLEDIIAVLDGCSYIEEKLKPAKADVVNFVKSQFAELLKDQDLLEEAVSGFIRDSGNFMARARKCVSRMRKIVG